MNENSARSRAREALIEAVGPAATVTAMRALAAAGLQIVDATKPACATTARDDLTRRIGEDDLSVPRAAERGLTDDEASALIRERYTDAIRALGDEETR